MALELKQNLKLSQQLIMTPQLQQAIKLLQLNRMELAEHCLAEMMENPMLEESVEATEEKSLPKSEELKEVNPQNGEGTEDINWENYLNSQTYKTRGERVAMNKDGDLPSFEANFTRASTLTEHLQSQLQLSKMIESDRKIGEAIIGNLDEDGYLRSSCSEIAQKDNYDVEDVEAVLGRVQEFDPVGVGARNLKECLLLQVRNQVDDHLMRHIIEHHLNDLENRNYHKIVKQSGYSKFRVNRAIREIMTFEPKPGRQFYDESANYITPDIYIYQVNGDYEIVQNDDGLPKLRISKLYEDAMRQNKGMADNTKDYINEKLKSAIWLIRSIHQRQRTIFKVTESIVKKQREFLDAGVKALEPMVLKDVSGDIGMHESTVSRVTTNKYVHTPQGLFELKYFFNSGIRRLHGSSVASEAVKDKIRILVQAEDLNRPYSDQELVELLRKSNIDIARRTVAKYREMLGIMSSSKRRQGL